MKAIVEIDAHSLEDDDTISGFKIKDLVSLAFVMKEQGVSKEDVGKFIKNAENAYEFVLRDLEILYNKEVAEALSKAAIRTCEEGS